MDMLIAIFRTHTGVYSSPQRGGTSSRTWTERATASKESLRAIFYEEKLFLAVNDWQTAAVFEAADDDRCSIKESANM